MNFLGFSVIFSTNEFRLWTRLSRELCIESVVMSLPIVPFGSCSFSSKFFRLSIVAFRSDSLKFAVIFLIFSREEVMLPLFSPSAADNLLKFSTTDLI